MPALIPIDPAMQALNERGAERCRQGRDALWISFFRGYLAEPVAAPYLRDLYPWFGNPTVIVEKFQTVYEAEGYSARIKDFLLTALSATDSIRHAEERGTYQPNVYRFADAAQNGYDRAGMLRLQEFFNFLYELEVKLKNGRWRVADIVGAHDELVQGLCVSLGRLLRESGQ